MDEDKEMKIDDSEKEAALDEAEKKEYDRAMEVLNKSRGARVKKINEQKKEKRKTEAKKTSEERKSEDKPANGFIEKCRKDPVIPACIILLIAAAVLVSVYVILPRMSVKSLGCTVDQFRSDYVSTEIYTTSLGGYNFAIPEVVYSDGTQVALTAAAENRKDGKLSYFSANIPNTATTFATAIQGSVRKSDNEITALRVLAQYSEDESYYNFLILYYASYMQTLFPGITNQDAASLAADALAGITSDAYISRDDISYRASFVKNDTISYIALDVIPSGNL